MLPSLLAAFAALASSGSSFPLEAHSLEQRQQQVPVNVSWANQGLSTANVIDGDGNVGAYSTDPYTGTGLISCDRSRYSFSLNINQENVDRGNTYRFIFGQTRYGSQGIHYCLIVQPQAKANERKQVLLSLATRFS